MGGWRRVCTTFLGMSVNESWLVEATVGHYHRVAEDLYGIQYSQGYWCELPTQENARVTWPPPGFIVVYTTHFDYGIRFSLDSLLSRVVMEYNISLAQLTPKSMRHIIVFRWVCEYLSFPTSLRIFRELRELQRNTNVGLGWWNIVNKKAKKGEPSYLIAYPYLSSVHEWKG